ncbi:succinate dehydrogenase assembly factor 2 [Dokdonella sp.]|uniref:FAD assembly factor SdhE n=1 Tax=Dokdonella sp. TaxID=2291710 RepID=UPI0025BA35E9|nr:succinate dehydrogenase assembly factor 2 [Dokdonella sp.]MBX3688120.1 succinate dehydrogenase assembly factor 2 [Dokdonella sp.]
MSDAELARLRWRARRGTRELDRMIGWWLEARYAQADATTRAAFAGLLEQIDPDLWDWLIAQHEPPPAFAAIIDEIRAHHCL